MLNILAFWDGWFDSAKNAAGQVVSEILYSICYGIDYVVYSFIPRLYGLIISLANVDLYTDNFAISALMNRVYVLVGVFMLFKLAFSVVRYIIDPNSFSDQTKGFTSLVKRVLIALVLLIMTPWLFGKIYEVQGTILNSNIISNLILGTNDDANSSLSSAAKDIQFLIFSPFFSINPVGELSDCAPTPDRPLANVLGTTDMALVGDGTCLNAFASAMDNDPSVQTSGVTIDQFFKGEDSDDARSFGAFGGLLYMKINNETDNAINYLPIASTLCGGYLVFLLLSFCIDIAGRAIKLMFLQILSPIAFITSIDPTSSSQNDKLKDWGKECLTTFLSLFLRLAVIYLVIQMVKVITSRMFNSSLYYEGFSENVSGTMNIFVYIFLVLGAFQVAKKIPELIEKSFGIKLSGDLSLNAFKSLSGNAGVGLLSGIGAGSIAGAMSGLQAGVESGAPVRGLLGGIATGVSKGISTKPGVGMFSDLRRKTYKDMTGNDMNTFNPWQMIYGIGGEDKIEIQKAYRKKAYEQLNDIDTELGMISRMNAEKRLELERKGVKTSNLKPNSKEWEDMVIAERSAGLHRANIRSLQDELKTAQSQDVVDFNKVKELNDKIAKEQAEFSKADAIFADKAKSAGLEFSGIDDANYADIKEYIGGINTENDLRTSRSKIEKDIATINDQISDMRQFYHVDESTKQSVDEAISNIEERDNKK